MTTPETELGPIATKVLYEDEQIRIWDNRLAPGELLGAHKHELDYTLVDVEGEKIEIDFLPGNEGEFEGHHDFPVSRGKAIFVKRGGVETARNIGDGPVRFILIEYKND
jgi:hypothetical protein